MTRGALGSSLRGPIPRELAPGASGGRDGVAARAVHTRRLRAGSARGASLDNRSTAWGSVSHKPFSSAARGSGAATSGVNRSAPDANPTESKGQEAHKLPSSVSAALNCVPCAAPLSPWGAVQTDGLTDRAHGQGRSAAAPSHRPLPLLSQVCPRRHGFPCEGILGNTAGLIKIC